MAMGRQKDGQGDLMVSWSEMPRSPGHVFYDRLGVKQPTAWTMKQKIMAVMTRREAETPLSGRVEMDDAYLGGMRSGGKRGRGAAGKTPFIAAVSTSPEGRPHKVKMTPVKGFRKREIARGARCWLTPSAQVVTDGLRCWRALAEAGNGHRAIRTGSGRQAARMAPFKWVNTTLGNIKSAITGTYRKLSPDHAERYFASFAWRYNRRYQLQTMILCLSGLHPHSPGRVAGAQARKGPTWSATSRAGWGSAVPWRRVRWTPWSRRSSRHWRRKRQCGSPALARSLRSEAWPLRAAIGVNIADTWGKQRMEAGCEERQRFLSPMMNVPERVSGPVYVRPGANR